MRLFSAIVLAAQALVGAWVGGWLFAVQVTILALIAFWEWMALTRSPLHPWLRVGALAALGAALLAVAADRLALASAIALVPLALALISAAADRGYAWLAMGLLYVAVPSAAVILIRDVGPEGRFAIVFIFLVAWTTDSAAYFGGRALGGPKLWPRVSPNKTWSGSVSGVAAALLVGAALAALLNGAAVPATLLAAAVLSVATQAGDLLESAVKRRFDAKDSGHIIPGHGGVLDRVDGLYGACAAAWLLAAAGGPGPLPSTIGTGG